MQTTKGWMNKILSSANEVHVTSLTIEPKYSNCVVVRTLPYHTT